METQSGPVIIKRNKRNKVHRVHGGAWKVAFADLMVCMMTFFLVLWVLQVVNSEDREKLINYFQEGNVDMASQGYGLGNSVNPIHLPQVATTRVDKRLEYVDPESSLIEGEYNTQLELEALAAKIKQALVDIDVDNSVNVEVTPQGLKLIISDLSEKSMFVRGGAKITPYYEDLLVNLAPIIKSIKNSLVITGHTDSVKFHSGYSTNWILSSNRANVARNTLVESGFPTGNVFQVSGMAETAPLNVKQPESSENRRVELFILTRSAKTMMETVYKSHGNLDEKHNAEQDYIEDYLDKHSLATEKAKSNQFKNSFDAVVEAKGL